MNPYIQDANLSMIAVSSAWQEKCLLLAHTHDSRIDGSSYSTLLHYFRSFELLSHYVLAPG